MVCRVYRPARHCETSQVPLSERGCTCVSTNIGGLFPGVGAGLVYYHGVVYRSQRQHKVLDKRSYSGPCRDCWRKHNRLWLFERRLRKMRPHLCTPTPPPIHGTQRRPIQSQKQDKRETTVKDYEEANEPTRDVLQPSLITALLWP